MSDPNQLDPDEQRALADLTDRYRRATAEADRPPAELDHAIREAARRAVKRRWVFTPFPHNWMVPASVVALLLLTVSIVHFMPTAPQPGRQVTTEEEAPLMLERRAESGPAVRHEADAPREKSAPSTDEAPEISGRISGYTVERDQRRGAEDLIRGLRIPAPESAPPAEIASGMTVSPLEEWTARIEAMLERGETQAAEREMRALLVQYPEATFEEEALRELAERVRSAE